MYSILHTVAFIAVAAGSIASAPVWAYSVQSAPNGAYALSSSPRGALSPMWYEYHNWRTRDAYKIRVGLQDNIADNTRANDAKGITTKSSMAYNEPSSHGYHNWRVQPGIGLSSKDTVAEG